MAMDGLEPSYIGMQWCELLGSERDWYDPSDTRLLGFRLFSVYDKVVHISRRVGYPDNRWELFNADVKRLAQSDRAQ
jgi:hypothetical protein